MAAESSIVLLTDKETTEFNKGEEFSVYLWESLESISLVKSIRTFRLLVPSEEINFSRLRNMTICGSY